ncbi:MAG: hypothetical protein KKI12_10140 [Proteobacteria bacterium]|nr:hypothetical protein [Pseudomonadota bacterium]MBU4258669.1 hypothetical protein [Pseudomonadota bacterium]MBU4288515.1 hypothetical protein [Pseudomonadota bacterium]MCG2758480.1 hypothetical protein [Desulfobacteraceae bacterium]
MFSTEVYSAEDSTTTAVINYICLGRLVRYAQFANNKVKPDCYIPSEFYKSHSYTIVSQGMALEDQIASIDSLASFEDMIEKIQKRVPEQKELYNEGLKNKVYELFESFLSSEEIEKARELFQLAVKFFPDEKKFSVAKNIIAPSKVVSSNKSETEGIQETTQFLKNLGKEFEKKWIAVSNGRLLGVSNSYSKLAKTYKGRDVFIIKVL